jgi:adenosylhomocysteine nucleosidase
VASGAHPGRIGVLAPMPSELAPVRRAFGLRERIGAGFEALHLGRVDEVEIVATRAGMGTRSARRSAERLLDAAEVDHVVVVGIAGGIGESRVGDVVVPEIVVDDASGRELRPSTLGDRDVSGAILTSDDFHVDPQHVARLEARGITALDMETSGVAIVCEERGVPWSVVRVISDRAEDHPDDAVIGMMNEDGSPRIGASLRFLATHPQRLPTMIRLAKGSTLAARRAAATAVEHCRRPDRSP